MKLRTMIFTAIAACTFALTPLTAVANQVLLDDTAQLVQKEEPWEEIDDALWATVIEHDVDLWIHTTNTLNGMDIVDYTDQWYETQSSRDDGIVLVVCAESRDYFIMTSGSCISAFTDAGLDYIEAQIVPDLSDGDYTEAFLTFAELCDDFLTQAETGKPYDINNMPKEPFNAGRSLLIALIVGLVAGGIGVLILFLNLKSVHRQSGAADYRKPGSFQLETKRDIYLYRKVEREEKPDNDKNGGSSTFKGNSGETRGGSGGSF